MKTDATTRFRRKIIRRGQCFDWTGARAKRSGHGVFWTGATVVEAHRFAYEYAFGTPRRRVKLVPLCGRKTCVHPFHWIAACKAGHPLTEDNIYRSRNGHGRCRACKRIKERESYAASKENAIEDTRRNFTDRILARV